GLTGARSTGDEVERVLRQSAAGHLVQPRHGRGEAIDPNASVARCAGHDISPSAGRGMHASGQTSLIACMVRSCPMNVTRSPIMYERTVTNASVALAESMPRNA